MAKAAKDTLIAFIDEVIHSIELDDLTNDRIDWIKERCGIIDMSVTETTDNSKTTTYTIKICF
jgi:ssDNA-binding replication factor A large subunit